VFAVKHRFPIFRRNPKLLYFDTAATAHKPKEVIDSLSSFYGEEYGTVHRAIYRGSLKSTEKYHATREAAAKFINAASTDEIVFTRGTTEALNLVARSYGKIALKKGDEILITEMEHHSNIIPWQMIAQETGATLRWISSDARGVLQWKGTITPRTKIVAVAHMSNVTGTIHPIREIAKEAHLMGAVIVVDGAQAAPHMHVDVQEMDVDFYAFSGHKCYGPTGTGILYGKRSLLEKMPPIQGGGDMVDRVEMETTTYQEPPLRFEAGTPNIGSVIALKAALDFIEEIGRDKIAAHEEELYSLALEELEKIEGVRILGTAPNKGPLLTFVVEGVHPLDLATFLDMRHIAVRSGHLCAQPILRFFGVESALRISFGIYNTKEDVALLMNAVREGIELHVGRGGFVYL